MARTWKLSASSVSAFKACPTRFKLAYVDGIRKDEDTDSQRIGTNWHAMHEAMRTQENQDCTNDELLAIAWEHLNARYASVPPHKDPDEWEAERMMLAVSIMAYLHHWSSDQLESIHTEFAVDLPLHHPVTGLPLPNVVRVGKIDRLCRWRGRVVVQEYKSTSKSIDPDSDYWDRMKMDTQVSKYALDLRDAQALGHLDGIVGRDEVIGNTLYDVFHKPTTKPKLLTQGDTATFIETGEYFGQTFAVSHVVNDGADDQVFVDQAACVVKMGKKGFAIRETVAMYGARLGSEMLDNPDKHFARREVPRTDAELREFRKELYSIYQTQRFMANNNHWFKNESQCKATFHCPFIPICHNKVDPDGELPAGFRRIYVQPGDKNEGLGEQD